MKRSVLIFSALLTILSQTACDSNKKNEVPTDLFDSSVNKEMASNIQLVDKPENISFSDFIYDVGPRFNVIKKKDLAKVRSFSDFIGEEHAERIVFYKSMSVTILDGDKQTDRVETSFNGDLTTAQMKLLQSANYSTNILIRADYREKNIETGTVENSYWTPYLTIVPEKQATYINGKDAIMQYLWENSESERLQVKPEKWQPAKVIFTVTSNGSVENIKLDRSSGYPPVDKTIIELISKTQQEWNPAQNADGDNVDQELVISYGAKGC